MQVPAPFDYARATSVAEALELLERHGEEARLVAGGHSLLPMMKLRLARPDWVVDINDVAELRHITEEPGRLRVGALTRHAELLGSEVVGRLFPIVHDAERVIADPVVRNRGTIGGSLAQADPAEDLTTVCDVLRAEVVIAGRDGERVVAMPEFHRGPYETACAQDEIVTEVRFPVRAGQGSAYEKVERRVGDWAVAAAGAALVLDDGGAITEAAVGLTALGLEGLAVEAAAVLVGQRPDEALFAEAARLAAAASAPVEDGRGPVDYKRHLADELTRRVLRTAAARAGALTAVQGG
ncbi:xanthine dehydrogenase family protein subunit M [Blastococcus sp. MG754426]|uniref:FAD binding domain-containing protein n=1 Tax=unclassified Blastococcus TaxID=2619396 RepID=UPI001EF10FAD|nr:MULTISPECIES: xanthine dehydrogenase family protein subunit M [unclassified Blastococcus]MCF6508094.1 xanthine dehydrogenase family protein subunit M [Blastococcus sp. MG754426]MCF6511577.1 xanthine dehydrogenase family protein subunit M [Blastococcus sp. MG754427]MCF6733740.1 xanthine dehydrogenase family protein subunit M [Blastococcus sp. KM273129]